MIQQLRLVQLMGVTGLVTLLLAACSGDNAPSPQPYRNSEATTVASSSASGAATDDTHPSKTSASPCVNSQVRECRVVLGAQGAVQNCFVGLQLCTAGEWGPCLEPNEIESQLDGS